MSYTKLQEQWRKEYIKKQEQNRQYEQKMYDIDEKIKVNQIMSNFYNDRKLEQEQEELTRKKIEVKEKLVGALSYKQWIILWDFLNGSLYEIENSLSKGKITEQDIFYVMDKANSIHNIFSY